jgi:uncharacterized ParB-like nuclease family protein
MSYSQQPLFDANPTLMELNVIRIDGGTQPRAQLDDATVVEYTEALGNGNEFPPVVVFYDGETYWLADGFHRVESHRRAGHTDITASIRQGTQRDA